MPLRSCAPAAAHSAPCTPHPPPAAAHSAPCATHRRLVRLVRPLLRPGDRVWRPTRAASLGLLAAGALACALPWTAPPDPPPGGAGRSPAGAEPWLGTPLLQRLHPPLPGALLEDARFLDGGGLALTVRFPPDPGREAWVLELPPPDAPGRGSLHRLGPPEGAPALAVAPAGDRVAYLASAGRPRRSPDPLSPAAPPGDAPATAQGVSPSASPGILSRLPLGTPLPDEVWVSSRPGNPGEQIFALPPDAAPERLVDLSWSPDGRHLLVLSQRPLPTGARRARLLWLDAGPPAHLQAAPAAPGAPGPVRQLATLPADVVPGSYSWAPGGERVALLTQAGAVSAAGVVDATLGAEPAYTYVADLDRGPLASPSGPVTSGAFAPLSWSPDGRRLVFAARGAARPAPRAGRPAPLGALTGSGAAPGLYLAHLPPGGGPLPAVQSLERAAMAPGWRPDGAIVALDPGRRGSPPALHRFHPGGRQLASAALAPLPGGAAYRAHWDGARPQGLLAASRGPAGATDAQAEYWLVRFGPVGAPSLGSQAGPSSPSAQRPPRSGPPVPPVTEPLGPERPRGPGAAPDFLPEVAPDPTPWTRRP